MRIYVASPGFDRQPGFPLSFQRAAGIKDFIAFYRDRVEILRE